MEPLGGGETVYKLGQKDAPSPPDFSRMTITNLYLSADEYDVLSALPAHERESVATDWCTTAASTASTSSTASSRV